MAELVVQRMRRNFMTRGHRRDALIDFMKEMLRHSFVLNMPESYHATMIYFEELFAEHCANPNDSRLGSFVPTVGKFLTPLRMREAYELYDQKYMMSKRLMVAPSFNEIRHILNLSQILAIGSNLKMISFDGDQTLYNDGGNLEDNQEIIGGIIKLLRHNVKVAVVTAAGYGLVGAKYAVRFQGLLDVFQREKLTQAEIESFYVVGGECNYLLKATPNAAQGGKVELQAVPYEEWQAEHLSGPRPFYWPQEQITQILDVAEASLRTSITTFQLRAKLLRKERAVGVFAGGESMVETVPIGHGSKKMKQEALNEMVLRVMEALRTCEPAVTLPYCVFNGGRDCWVDIGNKSVGVQALQRYFDFPAADCIHVGDQFLQTGNDFAARDACPCLWIQNPHETGKVLNHVLKYKNIPKTAGASAAAAGAGGASSESAPKFNVYTGEL
jgi:IMP and pyridine-specific 5'-nucleotidase